MIGNKKCFNCARILPLDCFYKSSKSKDGRQSECKGCCSVRSAKRYKNNSEEIKKRNNEYYAKNKDRILERSRAFYLEHPKAKDIRNRRAREYYAKNAISIREKDQKWRNEHREEYRKKIREYQRANKDKVYEWHKKYKKSHKEQILEASKEYRRKNKDKINQARLYRLRTDNVYALKEKLRAVIRDSLKTKHHEGFKKWEPIIGCSRDELSEHLRRTWKQRYGTEWKTQKYNIDHIIPLTTASTLEDVKRLNHYSNLQMLTPEDNRYKGTKL